VTRITGTARDITEQKAFERRLTYQAEHDSLTGLSNRYAFQQELDRLVARVTRSGAVCAVFYIDLDQFKYINDTLGHAAGDRLLVEISTLVSSRVREGDLFARFGGDEFTLLLDNVDEERAIRAAENVRALVGEYRFLEGGNSFNVTCSVGVAMVNEQVQSADEVLSHADIACNIAKAQGRNRVNLYNPADRDKAGMAEDMGWAARVREMLEQDRFQLVFQPIVAIADGRVHDYEVLMRMPCDDGQVILPGGFMPAAERFGLIHRLDRWMVRQAIQRLAQLRASGTPVCFSVNLSGRAFEDDGLLPLIRRMLEQTQLDPAWLTFEITETAAIANLAAAVRFIRALKEIGCRFALDDFGAGFCSFTYLKHLPVDKLKIDGSFVQGLAGAPVDQAMVRSLNQVAHALGKVTIAEYVEDARTLRLLQEYGVDYAQGFYLGRPEAEIVRQATA
ncbi:MAG TPA: EAL domain-containing protein, partial [Chromatiales bacterium]|nr:EAL domain-containing protein [Chromatiales bacterium]